MWMMPLLFLEDGLRSMLKLLLKRLNMDGQYIRYMHRIGCEYHCLVLGRFGDSKGSKANEYSSDEWWLRKTIPWQMSKLAHDFESS
jgi:hypothetical protein